MEANNWRRKQQKWNRAGARHWMIEFPADSEWACGANFGGRHEKRQWVVSIRKGQAWLICAARGCHLQLPVGRPAFQINRSRGG